MVQNIPLSDTFDENGGYGAYLCNYIRTVISTSVTAITGYSLAFGEGTCNSGYKASFGGVSMTSTSSPVVTNSLCCTSWRAFSNLTQTSEAAFKLATTAGSATDDSFRQACVYVRAQAGTFDDTWQHERNSNLTCYMLLLVNTLAQGCRFLIVRFNSGAVTVLGTALPSSIGLPDTALALIGTGRKLRLSVIGSGGNPNLSAYTSNADGTNELLIATIADSDPNKITTAGRCGFGMTTDRLEAGATRTATLCTYFRIVNDGPPVEVLRDEWERNPRHGQFNLTNFQTNLTDGNSVAGKRAQQHWIGDIYGQALFGSGSNRIPADVGSNRLKMPWSGSPVAGGSISYLLATYAPACGKCADKSIVVTYINPAPDPLRGTTGPANDIRLYLWETNALTTAQVWISFGLLGFQLWEIQFLEAGLQFSQADGGSLGLGLNIPITYRWIVSVTGTAPTRVWKFECRVNGVQIPFTGSPTNNWTLNGDGSLNWPEATKGALPDHDSAGWCRVLWNGVVGNPSPDPFIDDTRVDTFGDASPACCTTTAEPSPTALVLSAPPIESIVVEVIGPTTLLPQPTQLVLSAPPLAQLLVVTPTVSVPTPSQLVLFAPGISVLTDENRRDPAGQAKFAGLAAGQAAIAGLATGKVG